MLTDAAIKALKPKDKLYKVSDRDGMYVVVNPSGAVVFRYDYRMKWPPPSPVASVIEAEWRKRAVGVIPAQPNERPKGRRQHSAFPQMGRA